MAARYWVGGGSSANWNATAPTNWSATSGGAGNASVPGASDTATFDGAGASGNSNCTVNATVSLISFTVTSGYTSTITHNAAITLSGSWTMANSHTIAGTSAINLTGSTTITSGGQTWPNSVNLTANNNVYTLVGDLVIGSTLVINTGGGGGSNATVNRTTTEVLKSAGLTLGSRGLNGTAEYYLTGGTWSGSGILYKKLYLDGDSTISGTVFKETGNIKYNSGTITTTGSTLSLSSGNTSLDTNGMSWNNVTFGFTSGGMTYTLASNMTLTGTATLGNNFGATINGGYTLYVAGLAGGSVPTLDGAGDLQFNGGGTWSGVVSVSKNIIVNGNLTISASSGVHITGTITGSTGVVTGTLQIQGSAHTIDTAGVTWDSISFGTFTYTINSLLTGTGTFSTAGSPTFAGTSGWTCATFSHTGVSAFTVSLKESITYTITILLSCYLSRTGSVVLFTSSHASIKANLVLRPGALCRCLANFTRINASGGRPIRTFNGVVTDCNNVFSFFDLKTVALNR